jgi:putative transposase
MQVMVTEESYTSKCSFPDSELLTHQAEYVGTRVKYGLFMTATGRQINANVNASYSMIVKVVPDAFGNGRGCGSSSCQARPGEPSAGVLIR